MSVNSFKSTLSGLWNALGHGAWMLVAVMGISSLAIGLMLMLVSQTLGLSEAELSRPEWTLGLYAAQYGLGLLILLLVPMVIQKKNKAKLRELFGILRLPVWRDLGIAFLSFLPYFGASIALQSIVAAFIPGFNADQSQDVGFSDITGTSQLVIAFVALVILAPLAEELIFRGYLFGSAREKLSFWPAALITSALFGLVHGQWNVGLDTFVLSLVLCYLRERTGSIWAGVALHAIKNGLAFTLLFIFPVG